jgi:hypothetical protein
MAEYSWEQAMEWWENSGGFKNLIRNAAVNLLEESNRNAGCEDQGIGSSDINHEVFHMYRDWLHYSDVCAKEGTETNMVTFLMDVTADI